MIWYLHQQLPLASLLLIVLPQHLSPFHAARPIRRSLAPDLLLLLLTTTKYFYIDATSLKHTLRGFDRYNFSPYRWLQVQVHIQQAAPYSQTMSIQLKHVPLVLSIENNKTLFFSVTYNFTHLLRYQSVICSLRRAINTYILAVVFLWWGSRTTAHACRPWPHS